MNEEVECLRKLMYRLAAKHHSLTHPEILLVSQKIDRLLVHIQRQRSHKSTGQFPINNRDESDTEPHRCAPTVFEIQWNPLAIDFSRSDDVTVESA